jgi:hypothetical protein
MIKAGSPGLLLRLSPERNPQVRNFPGIFFKERHHGLQNILLWRNPHLKTGCTGDRKISGTMSPFPDYAIRQKGDHREISEPEQQGYPGSHFRGKVTSSQTVFR